MADVAAQRAALAETRARIDARLEELVDHVPERADIKATAMKYGGAVVGAVVGMGVLVLTTKSILHGRKTSKDARRYASAVLSALPEVAEAYGVHVARTAKAAEDTGPSRRQLRTELKAQAASAAIEEAKARRLAAIERGDDEAVSRGGVGTAVLMAAGVVGGVAVAQALGGTRGSQG